jgi:7-carboxy-7-deazaguanine synthase
VVAELQTGQVDPKDIKLPMVEIFETVEGEGTKAGFPTTFVRLFHCNLRCTWCDTPYSYAPAKPSFMATISEIVTEVQKYPHKHICLTGGEPLIHGQKSIALIQALAEISYIEDIHIETNGAIDLKPFQELRNQDERVGRKVRFILDYKLPSSGETDKMILENFKYLHDQDEIKFVIGTDEDFQVAREVLKKWYQRGVPLFSPVWETMSPKQLVEKILEYQLTEVKLSLQLHKVIWDPDQRGV